MTERVIGWIDGFMAAARLASKSQQPGWLTPDTLPAWASVVAALLSAVAAVVASRIAAASHKANALQAKSARRQEILRVTSENLADLLIFRDRFIFEMRQIKSGNELRSGGAKVLLDREIDKLTRDVCKQLNEMISANNAVNDAVFLQDNGGTDEWDDHIRSTLLKRQQITHAKHAIDLKIADIKRRASSIHGV